MAETETQARVCKGRVVASSTTRVVYSAPEAEGSKEAVRVRGHLDRKGHERTGHKGQMPGQVGVGKELVKML